MKFGFIGFGEVSYTLSKILLSYGFDVLTSTEGRSKKTKLVPFSEEITSTVNYINRNLDKPLDVDDLAARVYLSHSGLIWKFKKELGTTPSHYISLQRLRHAKQLLLNYPNYTVTQVAELCGYSNPFYFTNQFREYSGKSPTEFRRFHLKKDT